MRNYSSSTEPVSTQPKHWDWLFALLLIAAAAVAYFPALNGAPIWDDDAHLTKPELRSLEGLIRIWTQPGATQQYYPLVHTVFWVEHQFWGDAPLWYHVANLLIHCVSALLLLRILRKLEIPGAWLAALIFALHPIQTETVAWISELKNVLSGLFFFGSILTYLRFNESRHLSYYCLSLALFVAGLMSKSVIATLPVMLVVIFWWKQGNLSLKRDVVALLPFLAFGAGFGMFTAWVERNLIGAQGPEFNYTIIERGLIAGRAIWFYLSKLFLACGTDFCLPTLADQPDSLVAIFISRRGDGVVSDCHMLSPAMAWSLGGPAHFYRDAVPGPRLSKCLSISLFACLRPFRLSGKSGSDCAGFCRPRTVCGTSPAIRSPLFLFCIVTGSLGPVDREAEPYVHRR